MPIIVNFSFIVISCTRSSMRHVVIVWLFGKIFGNLVFSSLPFFMCFYMCFVHTFKLQIINSNNLFFKKKKRNHFFWVRLFISRILKHECFSELNEKTNFRNTIHHSNHKYNIKTSLLRMSIMAWLRNNWSFSTVCIIHFFGFEIACNLVKKTRFSMLSICLTVSQLFRVVLLYLFPRLQRIKEK